MKKIISFILIVSIIFSYRIPAQAAAPAIGLIGAAAIGATVLTIGGTQYAQKSGGSYSFNGSHLTREMIAYSNSAITKQTIDQMAAAQGLAQQAGGYFLGKAVKGIFDLKNAALKGILSNYKNLNDSISNYFSDNVVNPVVNDVLNPSLPSLPYFSNCSIPDGNIKITSIMTTTVWRNKDNPKNCSLGKFEILKPLGQVHPDYPNLHLFSVTYYNYEITADNETFPPSNDKLINDSNVNDVARHINNSIPSSPGLANDLDKLMLDHPELWAFPDAASLPENTAPGTNIEDYPPAWPITPSQIQQWSAANSIAAQQALVDDLQAKVDANPNDIVLQTSLSQAKTKLAQMQATSVGDLAQSEQKEKDLEISEPAVLVPELKSINLDPIKETLGIMMNKFPFSILGAAGSLFSALAAPPLAPSFVIDFGIAQMAIDLSTFDIFASNIRAVMSFLIYGLCAYVCLRIWSRF